MAPLGSASFVHLVGSIPLATPSATLEAASKHSVAKLLRSVPDGETGERKSFVQWQKDHLPGKIRKPLFGGLPAEGCPPIELELDDIKPLRYDDFAIESYAIFSTMREQGLFRPHARFQVCLPTPMTVVRSLVETAYCPQTEALYETRMMHVLKHLQTKIPSQDLSIQWDMPIEMATLEIDRGKLTESFFVNFSEPYFSPVKPGIMERFKRLASAIRPEVTMGFHMCYGNFRQKHWLEPETVDLVVDITNSLVQEVGPIHSIDFVHFPVPKDRADTEYLEPLKILDAPSTTLIFGLVHGHDHEGTKERIATAAKVWPEAFGISTECGMTGKSEDYLQSVLDISASAIKSSPPS